AQFLEASAGAGQADSDPHGAALFELEFLGHGLGDRKDGARAVDANDRRVSGAPRVSAIAAAGAQRQDRRACADQSDRTVHVAHSQPRCWSLFERLERCTPFAAAASLQRSAANVACRRIVKSTMIGWRRRAPPACAGLTRSRSVAAPDRICSHDERATAAVLALLS